MPHVLAFPSNKLARQQKSRILAATTLTALIRRRPAPWAAGRELHTAMKRA
jgi:hypothetical protein